MVVKTVAVYMIRDVMTIMIAPKMTVIRTTVVVPMIQSAMLPVAAAMIVIPVMLRKIYVKRILAIRTDVVTIIMIVP
jgi:hypothetical protein